MDCSGAAQIGTVDLAAFGTVLISIWDRFREKGPIIKFVINMPYI